MAVKIDGKAVSMKLRENLKAEVAAYTEKYGSRPGLAVVLVGDDPASAVYVRNTHTPAACSFPGENARSWEALGEARPGQSSLSAGARRSRAWAQSWIFDAEMLEYKNNILQMSPVDYYHLFTVMYKSNKTVTSSM